MQVRSGGGLRAVRYTLRKALQSGGLFSFWRAMRSRNACKTCALGMGGKEGGMTNEAGGRFEVCKKSVQAMAADMQGAIPDEFFERFSVSELRALSSRELEKAGRLTQPLLLEKGATNFRKIKWDEAINRCVRKLQQTDPDDSFFYFSGRSSNEAGFLLQLFARVYGTNHVNNCSYYCHQASGVGLNASIGTGTATIQLKDLSKCDLVFLIGANPASNHPRFMKSLIDLRRRGGKVVVVNPAREIGLTKFRVPSDWRSMAFGSDVASHYVQPQIGGDMAFMYGTAKHLVERGEEDLDFIKQHTNQWESWRSKVNESSWEDLVNESGVSENEIREVADLYAKSKATIFAWAMGITHHKNGVDNVQAIVNLALMRGMVGCPGAGLLPLRGHSNVQGMGSMGVVPQLKASVISRLEALLGSKLPNTEGLDTMGCMKKADEGKVKLAWCLGGNLYGSNPAAKFAHHAMNQIDQVVYLNTSLNTGHAWGTGEETIILPVDARDEESEITTQESMFSFLRRSSGGDKRHSTTRSETEIILSVAEKIFGVDSPVNWKSLNSHDNIRELISKAVPGFEDLVEDKEFHIDGRVFHQPKFLTADGKANFASVELPIIENTPSSLRLMSVRSEGQFNTVVFEEEDLYRNQKQRNVILLNAEDMKRMGIKHNQRVEVRSSEGSMKKIVAREFDISKGSALMYYPECNCLYPTTCDPRSQTPAYKNVSVELIVN